LVLFFKKELLPTFGATMKRLTFLATLLITTAAHAKPFTPMDLANLDRISSPAVSPDGARVVFDVRSTDYAANKGVHSIWVVCAACGTPAPVKLAASAGGASAPAWAPAWAPDGRAVYFLSSRSGSAQVWRVAAGRDGGFGTPAQVTALPLDVGAFRLSPDRRTLVVSQAVFPDCETPACTKARLDARAKQKTTGVVYDHLFVRHWDEWEDGTRNHLFALALNAQGVAQGGPVPLMAHFDGDTPTKPFGGSDDFAISPDSKSLVFSARLAGRTEPWSTNFDLYQVKLDGTGAPVDLTAANKAWDGSPVFSADGTQLAYRATQRPGFEADRFAIMVRDMTTGATREIDPGWDRSAEKIAWSHDGHTIYATAEDMGRDRLFVVDAAHGDAHALTQDGHVSDFDINGGVLVFSQDSLAAPDDLYTLADAGARRLTNINAAKLAGVEMGAYEQFSFAGWNNETVHGYVMKPAGFVAGQHYPVAFIVHGGPQGSFGDGWSYRWNPQTYAGAGFASVFIDFHGSTGYGQAFTDAISSHWGDRPLEDLQKGWAAALAKYPFLDGNRACALGASYGGFMIYWMQGVWNAPWKCLVDHDGVFDNRMMGYATEELWFSEWENGHATPWEKPENYERFNPVNHVADWHVPMLVIHGGHDYRIPLEQGLAAFTALQRKGVPSEFLTFPDENHWVLKPQNSVEWHDTVLGWLKRWTVK
jgi:dipeptidyl aminopeptidase/acylaminoacyl peptidase